jgi:hypothetical protein
LNAFESVHVTQQYPAELNDEASVLLPQFCCVMAAYAGANPYQHKCLCSSCSARCSLCYCCTVLLLVQPQTCHAATNCFHVCLLGAGAGGVPSVHRAS